MPTSKNQAKEDGTRKTEERERKIGFKHIVEKMACWGNGGKHKLVKLYRPAMWAIELQDLNKEK